MTAPVIVESNRAQCLPIHGLSGPRQRIMRITSNHFISVKPPKNTPIVNPFVSVTIGFITIGAAVYAANNGATMNALQLTALCGTKHYVSYLTDTGNTHCIIDSVPERASIRLDHIQSPRPVFVIIELEVFFVVGRAVFIQFAAKNPQRGMSRAAAFAAKLSVQSIQRCCSFPVCLGFYLFSHDEKLLSIQ
jgi:hypothetical protein